MATFRELEATLRRPKFDPYLRDEDREAFIGWMYGVTTIIPVTETIRACRDPKDDMFLEVAISGRADALLSSDRDLLVLHPFRGLPIVSPATFLERF
jgi:putative PIN family toxin of toxin-antitoxin system